MKKTLVAWFSHPGQNYVAGSLVNLERGNCEVLAEALSNELGLDSYRIRELDSYPNDYHECIERARDEKRADARPALADVLPDLMGYEALVLVYPNWWGEFPMPVRTFLDGVDLSGKEILPLCSNEGSGMGTSVRTLKGAYPEADVSEGLSVLGHATEERIPDVLDWAREALV